MTKETIPNHLILDVISLASLFHAPRQVEWISPEARIVPSKFAILLYYSTL